MTWELQLVKNFRSVSSKNITHLSVTSKGKCSQVNETIQNLNGEKKINEQGKGYSEITKLLPD